MKRCQYCFEVLCECENCHNEALCPVAIDDCYLADETANIEWDDELPEGGDFTC